MLRRVGLVLLAVFLVTALSLPLGCGDDEGDDTGGTSGATEPTATGDTSSQTTAGADTTEGAEGSAIYAAQCSSCHGASGEGGGAGPALQTRTDLEVSAIEEQVRQGGNGMPAFEGTLSDQEITAVSQYVADEIVQR
jgi:mono/diheme cytochrome c family protein